MSHLKKDHIFLILAVVLNTLSVLGEIAWLVIYRNSLRWGMMIMFTNESNFLSAGASLIYVICAIRKLKTGKEIPKWVVTYRFIGCVCMVMTCLTIALILSPMAGPFPQGYVDLMFSKYLFWTHTFCPLTTAISFLFFEKETFPFAQKKVLLGMTPVVLYAIVSTLMNLLRLWDGPYPFLRVYDQPVWMSVLWFFLLVGAGWLFSFLVVLLRSRMCKDR